MCIYIMQIYMLSIQLKHNNYSYISIKKSTRKIMKCKILLIEKK